ncbi:MAG TPA: iron-sulfur cluster assembly accessory protein [Myxococcota bacterium]|nr:iron-sulfur cluster assembly accessory protein [Myxococcota bacterium]
MSEKISVVSFQANKNQFPIVITERAQAMALKATKSSADEDLFLRVSIKGGGCAGLKYNLDIDDRPSKFDVNCQLGDLKVAVDLFSLHYLANTTIDYQETLEGAGFKFDNPNARKTCGCGSSFS